LDFIIYGNTIDLIIYIGKTIVLSRITEGEDGDVHILPDTYIYVFIHLDVRLTIDGQCGKD